MKVKGASLAVGGREEDTVTLESCGCIEEKESRKESERGSGEKAGRWGGGFCWRRRAMWRVVYGSGGVK